MTEVAGFAADQVPYVLVLAGFGMVVGNFVGGRLADRVKPVKACLLLLLCMATTLLLIYFTSESKPMALLMTFVAGGLSLAIAAPIQILMIKPARGQRCSVRLPRRQRSTLAMRLGLSLADCRSPWGMGTLHLN